MQEQLRQSKWKIKKSLLNLYFAYIFYIYKKIHPINNDKIYQCVFFIMSSSIGLLLLLLFLLVLLVLLFALF